MNIENFINGEFVLSKQTFLKRNPFNSEIISHVADATAIDLVKAIQAGQKSFAEWKITSLSERLVWLKKIKSEYIKYKNEIIQAESLDQGLPITFTEMANFNIGLEILGRFENELMAQMTLGDQSKQFSSVGLTAVILSWNLSNRLFIERALAAVLAGNCVIVKCSSMAPATAYHWAKILTQIEFPKGVIQFIHGQEQSFKDLLITHPGIKAISFTGTLENSCDILKKSSAVSLNQFKKIQIFSGSKNSAISLSEPKQEVAEQVLDSFLFGQGQLAWNSSRLFILEKHAEAWKQIIFDYLERFRPLENINDNSVWSPILKKRSHQIFNEIQLLAQKDQAKLILSNRIKNFPENYLRPLFTKDMSNCSTLQQDQVFSPLYILSEVKYPFDIPKYANVSYYGFGASLWFEGEKNQKVIEQLDVGQISLNRWFVYSALPLKAVKQSAFGIQDQRIFGDFYSNVKTLA